MRRASTCPPFLPSPPFSSSCLTTSLLSFPPHLLPLAMADQTGPSQPHNPDTRSQPQSSSVSAHVQHEPPQQERQQQQQQPPREHQEGSSPFDKQIEAAKAAKEAFQAHQEADVAMRKAEAKQMQAQEKAHEAAIDTMAQQNLAEQVADKAAQQAARVVAEGQSNAMQEKMEQSAIQHLAGQQLAQKIMSSQLASFQQAIPAPQADIRSSVLHAANQAGISAQAQLSAATSAAAAAQDPISLQVAKGQAEVAQQQMAAAQQLAAASESPETLMQAAQALNIPGGSVAPPQTQPMHLG